MGPGVNPNRTSKKVHLKYKIKNVCIPLKKMNRQDIKILTQKQQLKKLPRNKRSCFGTRRRNRRRLLKEPIGLTPNETVIQNGESASKDDTITESTSRDDAITESTLRDDTITESTSRDDKITESTLQDDTITESTSRDDVITESTSRDDVITESTSRDDKITESTLQDDTITESTSQDDVITESTSRDDMITESTSRDDTITESTSRDDTITESTSRDDTITESTSRDDTITESTSRDDTITESTLSDDKISKSHDGESSNDEAYINQLSKSIIDLQTILSNGDNTDEIPSVLLALSDCEESSNKEIPTPKKRVKFSDDLEYVCDERSPSKKIDHAPLEDQPSSSLYPFHLPPPILKQKSVVTGTSSNEPVTQLKKKKWKYVISQKRKKKSNVEGKNKRIKYNSDTSTDVEPLSDINNFVTSTTTTSNKSTTTGSKSTTTRNKSTATGSKSTATLNKSTATRNKSTTTRNKSTATGSKSTATLNKSTATRNKSTTTGKKVAKQPNTKRTSAKRTIKRTSTTAKLTSTANRHTSKATVLGSSPWLSQEPMYCNLASRCIPICSELYRVIQKSHNQPSPQETTEMPPALVDQFDYLRQLFFELREVNIEWPFWHYISCLAISLDKILSHFPANVHCTLKREKSFYCLVGTSTYIMGSIIYELSRTLENLLRAVQDHPDISQSLKSSIKSSYEVSGYVRYFISQICLEAAGSGWVEVAGNFHSVLNKCKETVEEIEGRIVNAIEAEKKVVYEVIRDFSARGLKSVDYPDYPSYIDDEEISVSHGQGQPEQQIKSPTSDLNSLVTSPHDEGSSNQAPTQTSKELNDKVVSSTTEVVPRRRPRKVPPDEDPYGKRRRLDLTSITRPGFVEIDNLLVDDETGSKPRLVDRSTNTPSTSGVRTSSNILLKSKLCKTNGKTSKVYSIGIYKKQGQVSRASPVYLSLESFNNNSLPKFLPRGHSRATLVKLLMSKFNRRNMSENRSSNAVTAKKLSPLINGLKKDLDKAYNKVIDSYNKYYNFSKGLSGKTSSDAPQCIPVGSVNFSRVPLLTSLLNANATSSSATVCSTTNITTQSSVIPSTNVPSTTVQSTNVPSTTVQSTNVSSTTVQSTNVPSTVQSTNVQSTNVPSTTVQSTNVPSTTVQSTNVPSTTVRSTNVPSTTVRSTNVPSTTIQSTNVPSTTVQSTNVPSTTVRSTNVPSTTVQSTNVPSTTVQSTNVPSTTVQSTNVPSTTVRSTNVPSTTVQSTNVPSTTVQSTNVPSTTVRSTNVPPTTVQSTNVPSTTVQSTNVPSTTVRSTNVPSTTVQSTNVPSTVQLINVPSTIRLTNIPSTTVRSTNVPSTTVQSTNVPSTVRLTNVPSTTVQSTNVPSTSIPSSLTKTSSLTRHKNVPSPRSFSACGASVANTYITRLPMPTWSSITNHTKLPPILTRPPMTTGIAWLPIANYRLPLLTRSPMANFSQAPIPMAPQAPIPMANSAQAPIPMANSAQAPIPMANSAQAPIPMANSTQAPIPMANSAQAPIPMANSALAPIPMANSAQAPIPMANSAQTPIPMANSAQLTTPSQSSRVTASNCKGTTIQTSPKPSSILSSPPHNLFTGSSRTVQSHSKLSLQILIKGDQLELRWNLPNNITKAQVDHFEIRYAKLPNRSCFTIDKCKEATWFSLGKITCLDMPMRALLNGCTDCYCIFVCGVTKSNHMICSDIKLVERTPI